MERYIDDNASLGQGVKVGRFSIIESDVKVGNGVCIGDNVKIFKGTRIGSGVTIGDGAVVGKKPVFAVTSTVKNRPLNAVSIADNSIIGTMAIIYAGCELGQECFMGDRALVRENCLIGERTMIGTGVIVENEAAIGKNCKVQSGAYITAHTVLEDNVFIAPMVITTNDNYMGRTEARLAAKQGPIIKYAARVGGGALLLPGITVAEETFVAAGAVVTKNTEQGKVYMGVPSRVKRAVPQKEFIKQED